MYFNNSFFFDPNALFIIYRCERLGLISLSYLWRREQHALFEEMCSCPIDAILIKIASLGLKVNHLGKSIQVLRPYLTKLNSQFGFHVCGEGGEYETLTLDSPLFLKKIVLDKYSTIVESSDEYSPVAYLHIEEFHLEEKQELSPERIKMNQLNDLFNNEQKLNINSCLSNNSNQISYDKEEYKSLFSCNHKKTGKFVSINASLPHGDAKFQIFAILSHISGKYICKLNNKCSETLFLQQNFI